MAAPNERTPQEISDEEIESLYRGARYFSTPTNIARDAAIPPDHRDTDSQTKIVYRWLLNHARIGSLELISEFTEKSAVTRKSLLSLKDRYGRKTLTSRDQFERNGFSILHVAVLFEQPEVVNLLLPDGKDKFKLLMERTELHGWLALHLCTTHTEEKGLEVVKLLLGAYHKEYERLKTSSTVLLRFKDSFHDNMAITPLHYASWASNYKVVSQLLGDPYLGTITHVHSVDLFLLTPLHITTLILIRQATPRNVKDTLRTAKLLITAADTPQQNTCTPAAAGGPQQNISAAVAVGGTQPNTSEEVEVSMLDICINAVDCCSYTPLHWAAHGDASEIMKLLLAQNTIKPLEKDREKKTPLHVAMESSRVSKRLLTQLEGSSTGSKKLLMTHRSVREDVDRRLKDRQICVDSSNATLVGASLVASVTFAALLQPPLGWVTYYSSVFQGAPPPTIDYRSYAAVGKDAWVEAFWIFNSLSFLFAASTVITCTLAVRPKSGVHVKDVVVATKRWLLLSSHLYSLSLLFVLGAFVVAGIAALPPPVLLKVKSFIAPGTLPFLFSVVFCVHSMIQLPVESVTFIKKQFQCFRTYFTRTFVRGATSFTNTLEQRQETAGLAYLVKLLTQSSDRFEISGIMSEIEQLRPRYHRNQCPKDCRKEATTVTENALLSMKKIKQTTRDSWPSNALGDNPVPPVPMLTAGAANQ